MVHYVGIIKEMISDDDGHWKGILYFDLQVHNIFFNKKGKYFIKLSINGSRGDLHKVQLYLNNQKKSIFDYEYTSQPCYQEDLETPCKLDNTQFKFEMPEEFSEGEVYLLFETYQFTDNPLMEPFKCGEGRFLIFPCAAPIQSNPSTSTDKELCYNFTTQITINQLFQEEQVYINVGQVHITILLEIQEQQGPTISRNIKIHNRGIVNPVSQGVISKRELQDENDSDMNQDSKFSSTACTDVNFEKNSFTSNAAYSSANISQVVHPGCRRNTHLPDNILELNKSPNSPAIQEPSEADNQRHPVPPQHRRATLPEANDDQSNFLKAWTTSVEQGSVHGDSKDSLSNWTSEQVDSLAGAGKLRDNTDKGSTSANKRKIPKGPDISRNVSISSKRMAKDPPLSSTSQGPPTHHLCGSRLNEVGTYEVVVQVHSACDLPSNSQGRPPQAYVTGKTTSDEQASRLSQCATHATLHPTYSPLWEELLVVKVPKEDFRNQELILCVVDHPTKILITTFRLPLEPLRPFYPYHIELEQVGNDTKAKLFITMMFKTDELTLPSLLSKFFGLEVVLRHFTSPLADKYCDPLMAVIRVVPSFTQYREMFLEGKPREACIKTSKVKCPSSELASKLRSICAEDQHNLPQITFSGEPPEQPKWDQIFFFHGDERSLFSLYSALVIEYFSASQVVSFGRWQPRSPIGYSFCNLDHSLLAALQRDNASMGLRIENIAIKDSPLQNKAGEPETMNIILRLVTSKRPDPMLLPAYYNILPVIDMAATESTSFLHNFPQDRMDNTNEPFPEDSGMNRSSLPLPVINQHTGNQRNDSTRRRSKPSTEHPNLNDGLNQSAYSVMERQTKEIEKQRYAMKKMADDIIQLKSEATRLHATNSRLCLELDHRSEKHYSMCLPSHFENTTHAELVQRIVIIKGSLDEQSAINRELRLDVQSLQNQLIKKNEKEKDFYKLQDAHKNQQVLLQKMQERLRRTKTLEETCKKQEKVIIRLEDFLANSKTKDKGKDKKSEEEQAKMANEALSEENKRLRAQLLNYERTSKAVDDMDRLQVHDKLQRAEGRVAALEKELLDNTRRWARDKAELQLKLSETQMSRESGHWKYPTLSQEPLGLFDRTPPASRSLHTHSRRASPKLSPLSKK